MISRPILFSAPMVRAILSGGKTQTRRVVKMVPDKHVAAWWWKHCLQDDPRVSRDRQGFAEKWCPYGLPSRRLMCYRCSHEHDTTGIAPDISSPERRLHGGVGWTSLQPNKVQRLRTQTTGGLVSAERVSHQEGLSNYLDVTRERQSNPVCSSAYLHGVPRRSANSNSPSQAFGWAGREQLPIQPALGDRSGELGGQEETRDGISRGKASRIKVHGFGEGTYSLGHRERAVQSHPCRACLRCSAANDTLDDGEGDELWVRETWRTAAGFDTLSPTQIGEYAHDAGYSRGWMPLRFDADGTIRDSTPLMDNDDWGKTRVSIHMPRWASRITLDITAVRVQRLQDITAEDARAEGIRQEDIDAAGGDPVAAFRILWDSINGKTYPWSSNPWVWCVGFNMSQGADR